METTISPQALGGFFAWAPLVLGVAIYATAWAAKRKETADAGVPIRDTYACAKCGKRGSKEHMVPQVHEGAVSYYCTRCAGH